MDHFQHQLASTHQLQLLRRQLATPHRVCRVEARTQLCLARCSRGRLLLWWWGLLRRLLRRLLLRWRLRKVSANVRVEKITTVNDRTA
jgi:hypothetical protein